MNKFIKLNLVIAVISFSFFGLNLPAHAQLVAPDVQQAADAEGVQIGQQGGAVTGTVGAANTGAEGSEARQELGVDAGFMDNPATNLSQWIMNTVFCGRFLRIKFICANRPAVLAPAPEPTPLPPTESAPPVDISPEAIEKSKQYLEELGEKERKEKWLEEQWYGCKKWKFLCPEYRPLTISLEEKLSMRDAAANTPAVEPAAIDCANKASYTLNIEYCETAVKLNEQLLKQAEEKRVAEEQAAKEAVEAKKAAEDAIMIYVPKDLICQATMNSCIRNCPKDNKECPNKCVTGAQACDARAAASLAPAAGGTTAETCVPYVMSDKKIEELEALRRSKCQHQTDGFWWDNEPVTPYCENFWNNEWAKEKTCP